MSKPVKISTHIRLYLKKNKKIKGFTRNRLNELVVNDMASTQPFEWRLLIAWSGLYVFQFEEKYNVKIQSE